MCVDLEPVSPGEILLEEFLKPFHISQNRLAREIGISPGRVNEIIKGKQRITADMALRLHRFFGSTPDFWMNLQTQYDLKIAYQKKWDQIKTKISPFAA